eukprot:GHVS01060394.1.p1 GENE.GHVS01060394.1~~GHVS01060394.1.p1  ORF type:complete len:124 (-),score=17.99 GHVS01060394.1:211-582(-)
MVHSLRQGYYFSPFLLILLLCPLRSAQTSSIASSSSHRHFPVGSHTASSSNTAVQARSLEAPAEHPLMTAALVDSLRGGAGIFTAPSLKFLKLMTTLALVQGEFVRRATAGVMPQVAERVDAK